METITLGGGCFWCLDAVYRRVKGVTGVISGYAGGHVENPAYHQVCQGVTGHAEVVLITFDSSNVSLEQLLEIFWTIHDPTTLNRQGADTGTQYRSIILYTDDRQKRRILNSLSQAASLWGKGITTEVKPLNGFYPAEEEHQDYFNRHPDLAYCTAVINPKLEKLRSKHAGLLG